LREHLAQHHLFGEVLRPDHQGLLPRGSAGCETSGSKKKAQCNLAMKPPREEVLTHRNSFNHVAEGQKKVRRQKSKGKGQKSKVKSHLL
jgi:hypothetical protein